MTPRVSVVVPTRDRLASLQRALASVTAQTFRSMEVVVVDDGSTDGTMGWLAGNAGVRRVTNDTPGGAGAARNRGIAHARGELIAFLDDDDVWQPSYLEEQVRNLDATPGAALSYADHLEVGPADRAARPDTQSLLGYSSVLVRLLAEGFIHTMSVVVCRRRLFDTHGAFDERLRVVQDLEWYARLLAAGEHVVHLPRTLVGRTVPGGLVMRHRQWYDEERHVVDAALATGAITARDAALVRAYRSLFFAHLALSRRDATFAIVRLAEALETFPLWTLRIATRRMVRRLGRARRAAVWDAPEPVIT